MTDLISREALLKSIEKAEPINLGWITDQITNAPAVSGDVVAYGIQNSSISGMKHCLMSVRLDIPSDDQYGGAMWIPLYTAPQQPQSVADALEEAAKICRKKAEDYASLAISSNEVKDFSSASICTHKKAVALGLEDKIRALIKRNAKVVE